MPPSVVTFSRSFTIIPTYECFNRCTYCNFRKDPTQVPRHTPAEVHPGWLTVEAAEATLDSLKATPPIVELLVMAGEVPPTSRLRAAWHQRIADVCRAGLRRGLLPHTNVGPLSRSEMAALAAVNASMGLMLETTAPGLAVHAWAPSKDPDLRLVQLNMAGELRIPFTSGLLLGIGETFEDRRRTLEAIAQCHRQHGHIQEVILQPHSRGAHQKFEGDSTWHLALLPAVVAEARAVLPADVVLQVPPNLVLAGDEGMAILRACLDAGARDLGGISPKDEVNPDFPFHGVDGAGGGLRATLARWGYELRPRLPVHAHLRHWMRPWPAAVAEGRGGER
eukprot:EG_transcript_13882